MGDSAGGGLSTATCLALVSGKVAIGGQTKQSMKSEDETTLDGNGHTLDGEVFQKLNQNVQTLEVPGSLVLLSPWLDLSYSNPSSTWWSNSITDYLPTQQVHVWPTHYIGQHHPKKQQSYYMKHPLVSPFYATSTLLSYFPPTLLVVGEAEQLYGDCRSFYNKLYQSLPSKWVHLNVVKDMPHVFLAFG